MKWYYLLLTSQEQLLQFLVYVVYVDDNSELSVICISKTGKCIMLHYTTL